MDPKKLSATQQTWTVDETAKTQVFNAPEKTGKSLDSHQGKYVRPVQFAGTCGLVSCVNVMRLAGMTDITEEEVVEIAVDFSLCTAGLKPEDNGGTNIFHRQSILKAFGIESDFIKTSILAIAQCVAEGRGVIISVDAGMLWNDPQYLNGLHAITVTSVKTDLEGHILGFYICDSGRGMDEDSSRYIDVEHMARSISHQPMNVTADIIR